MKIGDYDIDKKLIDAYVDEFCDSMIINPYIRMAKKISGAKTQNELDKIDNIIDTDFNGGGIGHELTEIQNRARKKVAQSVAACRICGKKFEDGVAHVNDYLADMLGERTPKQGICLKCFNENPDHYADIFKIAFVKR